MSISQIEGPEQGLQGTGGGRQTEADDAGDRAAKSTQVAGDLDSEPVQNEVSTLLWNSPRAAVATRGLGDSLRGITHLSTRED